MTDTLWIWVVIVTVNLAMLLISLIYHVTGWWNFAGFMVAAVAALIAVMMQITDLLERKNRPNSDAYR